MKNRLFEVGRWGLPVGWLLAAAGCYGPWIAHKTAALTLTGPDMAEFIKFLPAVGEGSLTVIRQSFYLPIVAVVLSVALLVGSPGLRYSWLVRASAVLLSVPLSTQILPPAWSPTSLLSAEFRLQPIILGLCWLALAGFWLLGRLPQRWTGLGAAALAVAAAFLSTWQYVAIKPEIDVVYGRPAATGWGLALCLAGLLLSAAASIVLALARGETRLARSEGL